MREDAGRYRSLHEARSMEVSELHEAGNREV